MNRWLVINQLDKQLKDWRRVKEKYGLPKPGWVKTIRTALQMTTEQLGIRLGLTGKRISQLEAAESNDAVTLHSLRSAANAMDCELIYVFVPKDKLSLEKIIKTQANQVAIEKLSHVAHTMALEAQPIDKKDIKIQFKNSLLARPNKKIWQTQTVNIPLKKSKSTTDKQNKLKKLIGKLKDK